MTRTGLALILWLPLCSSAFAQALADCDGTTVEMTKCVWDAYEEADAELNALWPEVLAGVRPNEGMPEAAADDWKSSLRAAQRAWVTFKEQDCEGAVAHEWYCGTGANSAVGACLYEHTRARIDDLRQRYATEP
jgi:uncharacterized protein YecT (DUF1311 family)